MRTFSSYVGGLKRRSPETDERRDAYAAQFVTVGDALAFEVDPKAEDEETAIIIRHQGFDLGYVPNRRAVVASALAEGVPVGGRVTAIRHGGFWLFKGVQRVEIEIRILRKP
jgi:hypothetical protein